VAGCGGPVSPARAPDGPPVAGVILADWSAGGYAGPACGAALDSIAATGATELAIVVTYYVTDVHASAVQPRADTPSRTAVEAAARAAADRGLAVGVKVHVDVEDGTWRARIDPADPERWFRTYGDVLVPWAETSDAFGASRFFVGTELAGTLRHETEWRALVARLRGAFSRPLSYAASWDEADRVPFWDALDVVGVNAYFPLATRTDPTRVDLLVGWQVWESRLDRLCRRTGRPVCFAEIGYRSIDGAACDPFDYSMTAPVDLGEQADLYWAALEATHGEPWFSGMYWWNWRADGSAGPTDRDYTPAGKPAAAELAAAWTR
jgi:hypothetical protein